MILTEILIALQYFFLIFMVPYKIPHLCNNKNTIWLKINTCFLSETTIYNFPTCPGWPCNRSFGHFCGAGNCCFVASGIESVSLSSNFRQRHWGVVNLINRLPTTLVNKVAKIVEFFVDLRNSNISPPIQCTITN